jgi:Rad3-related DNA helicase
MFRYNESIKIFYPLKMKPREEQLEALNHIKKSINTGNKFILNNLPTGIGKSYLVNMFINWYLNSVNNEAKFSIITNSKLLQEQYTKEFNFFTDLKGKSNYTCLQYNTNCEEGLELCSALKTKCDTCPYKIAKEAWIKKQVSLTNFHLFNTFHVFQFGSSIAPRDANVLIIDEAHNFEEVFCDFISYKLSPKLLDKYGFTLEETEYIDNTYLSKIDNIDDYADFLNTYFLNKITQKKVEFDGALITPINNTLKLKYTKYVNYINSNIGKIENFIKEYYRPLTDKDKIDPKNNWVLEVNTNQKEKIYSGKELTIQAVWAYPYLEEYIWKHYDHVIFMSGTILDKDMFSYLNGLTPKYTTYLDIESPFKIENRPIYYMKDIGKMSYDNKHETFKKQKEVIKEILEKFKTDKGIIHTNSYEFSKMISDNINDKRLVYHDITNRIEMLNKHIGSELASVIVSSSMVEGVDLKDELSRFQIIMKIPYPSLNSNKIKQRMKTHKDYYNFKTLLSIMQMYGRSVRHYDDYCSTYILDSNFSDLMRNSGKYFPRWFSDAIIPIYKI